jgi:nucleotidyltransferase substrate binding protein (TIGR01987 family)
MEEKQDIRWEQRFSNFRKALKKLSEAVVLIYGKIEENEAVANNDEEAKKAIDDLLKEGLIQRFEYTFELAWNVMKDYALYQGNADISGSRDAIRFAFSIKLIEDGGTWMAMIQSRIKSTHTYNEETANEIFLKVLNDYQTEFLEFEKVMEGKRSDNQQGLYNK